MPSLASRQLLFRDKANGSLIVDKDGKTIHGSRLIGQQFTRINISLPAPPMRAPMAWPMTRPVPAAATSARHRKNWRMRSRKTLQITAPKMVWRTNAPVPGRRRHSFRQRPGPAHQLRNAELQTPRVAKARGLSEDKVRELIKAEHRRPPALVFSANRA